MIEAVQTNPAMPVWWGKNQSGMQAKEELDDTKFLDWPLNHPYFEKWKLKHTNWTARALAQDTWLQARDAAVSCAQRLNEIGLHKQIANRLLEPWFHIRIILSGTEFENFFALRAHPDAQPEIQALAYQMLDAYNASTPKQLQPGEWHIPFGDQIDSQKLIHAIGQLPAPTGRFDEDMIIFKQKIAIARCARISYLNYEGKDDYAADIKLCDRLFGSVPRHLSPTEHVAQCEDHDQFIANFKGWKQYRYTFADQSLTDSRVKRS